MVFTFLIAYLSPLFFPSDNPAAEILSFARGSRQSSWGLSVFESNAVTPGFVVTPRISAILDSDALENTRTQIPL